MAADMALSCRVHNQLPVALVADPELAKIANLEYGAVFSCITQVPPRFHLGRALKYGVVEASPFRRALYIDADCLVVGSLQRFWRDLDGVDLALVGEILGPDDDRTHHGFSTQRLMTQFAATRYLKCNSGVFYFDRRAGIPLMDECLEQYRELLTDLRGGFIRDEIALGLVGGRRGLSTFPEPGPMYWGEELKQLTPEALDRPVCHFLAPVGTAALEHLLGEALRRRREAGRNLSTTMGHSTGLIREQCPVW